MSGSRLTIDRREARFQAAMVGTLILLMSSSSQLQDCEREWFGPSCDFKCRCARGPCDRAGMCAPGDSCQKGWFGPECQYADLAYNRSLTTNITDGDDSTCISTGISTTVKLDNSYHFTWLRVHVNTAGFLLDLAVFFSVNSTSLTCDKKKTSSLDAHTMDIYCQLHHPIATVTISGTAVSYLCSLYVSGGRNIALGQPTGQINTYSENSSETSFTQVVYKSDLAVDGMWDVSEENTCAISDDNDTLSWWNVSLPDFHYVSRIVIYTFENNTQLDEFVLEGYTGNGSQVFQWLQTSSSSPPKYTIVPPQVYRGMTQVKVRQNSYDQFFILCEAEIYGDYVCELGRYGYKCEQTCNCARKEPCFVSTRLCPAGCAAGYMGTHCEHRCEPGTYGPGCQMNCSQHCSPLPGSTEPPCNFTTGHCLAGCTPGYMSPLCTTVCQPGTYGADCAFSCSFNCRQKTVSSVSLCDFINGNCPGGCKSGYTDPRCQSACAKETYGQDCGSRCNENCEAVKNPNDSSCDIQSGQCLYDCKPGFKGLTCSDSATSDHGLLITVGTPALILAGLMLVVVVFCLLSKKLRSTPKEPETTEPGLTTDLHVPVFSETSLTVEQLETFGSPVDPGHILKLQEAAIITPQAELLPTAENVEQRGVQ